MQDWIFKQVSFYLTTKEYCYLVFALGLFNTIELFENIPKIWLPNNIMVHETKRAIRKNKYALVKYLIQECGVEDFDALVKTAIVFNRKAIVKLLVKNCLLFSTYCAFIYSCRAKNPYFVRFFLRKEQEYFTSGYIFEALKSECHHIILICFKFLKIKEISQNEWSRLWQIFERRPIPKYYLQYVYDNINYFNKIKFFDTQQICEFPF